MKRFKYYTPIILQKVGRVIFFVLYKIFIRIEIRGTEHIRAISKTTRPVILASNHTSELDVTAIPLVLPFFSPLSPIYFVSNTTEKYKTFGWRSYFYGGVFFNMLGGYAVHSGSRDYAVALEEHIALLKQHNRQRTLWIAPEGMRTRDGRMNPARGGLGYLVYATNAIVIPIAINTFFNISPWEFFTCRRKVVVTIGEAMNRTELVPMSNPGVNEFRHAGQLVLDKIENMMEN